MHGLMMERPLLISALLTHAEQHHPEREVVSAEFGGRRMPSQEALYENVLRTGRVDVVTVDVPGAGWP